METFHRLRSLGRRSRVLTSGVRLHYARPVESSARGSFSFVAEPIADGQRYRLLHHGRVVSYERAVHGLREEREVRDVLAECLQMAPHEAFFWETPPVGSQSRDRAFELVLIDSPVLARVTADPAPFARQLAGGPGSCVMFPNLSGDAWLVVPRALADHEHYAHLARFVRGAPHDQVDELLRTVGLTIERWWSERSEPLWVSTSGLGVHWLHVRFDTRPKYYTHGPYRDQNAQAARSRSP
jgi:hypothetical protein